MLVEESLIVGLEEQIQVLADREVQVAPLRPPGKVGALRALVHFLVVAGAMLATGVITEQVSESLFNATLV